MKTTQEGKKMKIRMLQTRRGTEDGYSTKQYMEGEVYDVVPHLARTFLAAKYAERAEENHEV